MVANDRNNWNNRSSCDNGETIGPISKTLATVTSTSRPNVFVASIHHVTGSHKITSNVYTALASRCVGERTCNC